MATHRAPQASHGLRCATSGCRLTLQRSGRFLVTVLRAFLRAFTVTPSRARLTIPSKEQSRYQRPRAFCRRDNSRYAYRGPTTYPSLQGPCSDHNQGTSSKHYLRVSCRSADVRPRCSIAKIQTAGAQSLKDQGAARTSSCPPTRHWSLENSHPPLRQREQRMKRFKSPGLAQRFLSIHAAIDNVFNIQRQLIYARLSRPGYADATRRSWRETLVIWPAIFRRWRQGRLSTRR